MKRRAITWMLLAAALAAGCGPVTTTTSVWRNPEMPPRRFSSILVMGVAEDQIGRRKYEDTLVAALRARGVRAAPSYSLLPQSRKLTQEQTDQAIRTVGFDGVLVTHVAGVEKETVYVPGHFEYFPRPGYHGYYGYYGYYAWAYDHVYHPGYYDTFTTVSLETSLYEAPSGRPAWGMRSQSIDPSNVDALIGSLVEDTVNNLAASGLL